MAKSTKVYSVLISSPGDVKDERGIAEEIINELNNVLFLERGFILNPVMWETHSYPGISVDGPQSVIDDQLGDDYDIFVGILWGRFGTPTKTALSGTEEEFNRAYERWKKEKETLRIMIYFKEEGIPPGEIDVEQLQRLKLFKERIKDEIYFFSYEEASQFRNLFRAHLIRLMIDGGELSDSKNQRVEAKQDSIAQPVPDISDEGFLDLIELSVDDFGYASNSLKKLGAATEAVGEKTRLGTEELNSLNAREDRGNKVGEYKKVMNSLAEHMLGFVAAVEGELPEFSKYTASALERYGRATSLLLDFQTTKAEQVDQSIEAVVSMQEGIEKYFKANEGLIASIKSSPRMTSSYNFAKRKTIETLEKLQSELTRNGMVALETEEAMRQVREKIVKKPKDSAGR